MSVNKRYTTFSLLLLLLLSTCYASAAFPLTILDDLGQTLTISTAPQRIISLAPSNTEILFALGLDNRIVAVDTDSNYPPAVQRKTRVGSGLSPSLESIVALRPDLVLLWDNSAKELQQKLLQLNIKAVAFAPQRLTEIYGCIERIGRITGTEETAQTVVAGMRQKVATVTAAVAKSPGKPLVFYEVWPDPLFTAGPGSFIDELINLAGGTNIAADTKTAWPVLSMETVIVKNPDVILTPFARAESVVSGKNKASWANIKAVRLNRVYQIDQDIMSRPGPRLADGLVTIAKLLHPGLL
jgi:iron complex transport system substrate-binding protein